MITQDQKDQLNDLWRDYWKQAVALLCGLVIAAAVIIGGSSGDEPAPTPSPTPSPTVPAIPPSGFGTGVDGAGALPGGKTKPLGLPNDLNKLTAKQRSNIVVEPQAGTSQGVKTQQTAPGVGGLKLVKSPAWKGWATLNAGEYYSNKTRHWAWDVGLWTGTNVFAAFGGKVVGLEDGTKNNKAGVNPGSGSPSNWILLCRKAPPGAPHAGKTVVLYYQHLSPGLSVRRGQNVKLGQQIAKARMAKSGNSGFSTGPHLHIAGGISNIPCNQISQWEAKYQLRYRYLQSKSYRVWPTSDTWQPGKPQAKTITLTKIQNVAKTNGSGAGTSWIRTNLKAAKVSSTWTPKMSRHWKRVTGSKYSYPTCTTLTRVGSGKIGTGKIKFAAKC